MSDTRVFCLQNKEGREKASRGVFLVKVEGGGAGL